MKRILIFAGTTEGRELSAILAKEKIEHTVCVATEYGSMLTEQNEYAKVLCGRMDEEKMREVFNEEKTELIVDATHPYAYEVSRNIKSAIEGSDIEYIRLIRDMGESLENSLIRHFENIESCIVELRKIEGNILLTTGSRELSAFASEKRILDRLFVRVIPSTESLAVCNENGIKGKNIIAMQGPFTTLMNEAVIDMYDIACVVSKQSGINGGFFEKAEAALNKNIPLFVIGLKEKEEGFSLEDTVRKLTGNSLCENEKINDESANEKAETDGKSCFESAEITGNSDGKNKEEKSVKNFKDNLKINLVGVGMGQRNGLTLEALEAIENADTIIGAQRLLDIFNDLEIEKYPYYLAKDIVPLTEELFASKNKKNIAVLFSGDSSFYSGATLLYD
ncbi:MAG: precorrin-6A reductase, partial [Lachnospiraceae bacterium]|nr:precorrin-6A reductase [Lachnospiraceae bacterium]